jgi:hypothetical protein
MQTYVHWVNLMKKYISIFQRLEILDHKALKEKTHLLYHFKNVH